jgi:hypothetical protein
MRQDIHVHLDLSVPTRTLIFLMAAALLVTVTPELGSENVTLSTYYPAPSGVYNQMITTGNTFLASPIPATGLPGGSVGIGTTNPGTALLAVMNGNVGIGTTNPLTSPSAQLHLWGSTAGGMHGGDLGIGQQNDSTPYMRLGMDTGWNQYVANNAYWAGGQYNYVNGGGYGGLASEMSQVSGQIAFRVANGGANPVTWRNGMTIDNGGNVEIGQGNSLTNNHLGYLYIDNTNTGCNNSGIVGANGTPCGAGTYATWTPGVYIDGVSYQNRGYPAVVSFQGGVTNTQVWGLNPSNGNWVPGTLQTGQDGPGTIWCCPK